MSLNNYEDSYSDVRMSSREKFDMNENTSYGKFNSISSKESNATSAKGRKRCTCLAVIFVVLLIGALCGCLAFLFVETYRLKSEVELHKEIYLQHIENYLYYREKNERVLETLNNSIE